MGCGGDWDVDKYRHPSEPKHHWELKKTFMEAIKDRSLKVIFKESGYPLFIPPSIVTKTNCFSMAAEIFLIFCVR